MSRWHFAPKRPSDKTRDPVASEFFSSDAIKNAGEALVREGIQNSLDARVNREETAKIRLYVSGHQAGVAPSHHQKWFDTAWQHYQSPKNGLRPGTLRPNEQCGFLAFEDFGTTGLTGDRSQYQPVEDAPNAFFNFFRAEGKTDKGGDDRGRWGVGKQVFPVLAEPRPSSGTETIEGGFLMGGCILKHHFVGDVCYKPDGYWGDLEKIAGDDLVVPVSDQDVLSTFRRDFDLKRQSGQCGLSVVVPWLDVPDEGKDSGAFERSTLALAVIEGYFIPIIEGRLEVSVEDPSGAVRLSRETYRDAIADLSRAADARLQSDLARVQSLIALTEIARAGAAKVFTLPPCPVQKASWSEEMLPPKVAEEMRDVLAQGGTLKVVAGLTVRLKGTEAADDTFSCLIARQPNFNHRPCHVREDIIIPNVDSSRVNGHSCIVRIDGGPLATLLGDSEGPAHTEWQASSRNFKDKYVFGGKAIEFVSNFPTELVRRIHATSKELDRTLLLDLFQDKGPEPKDESPKPKPPKPGPNPPPDPPSPDPPTVRFRIAETTAGFTVSSVDGRLPVGVILKVKAAYETSKGNPFTVYNENDFRFTDSGFELAADGCETKLVAPNEIWLSVHNPDFTLRVTGFDINRDIVVRANELKPTQATEQDQDE